MKLFPGQVEKLYFNLEQVEVLASPFKGDVFWAFSSSVPASIADIAKEIGKSAQGIHYHVVELVNVGLLIAVGERKRHARTEKLYVRAGYRCFDLGKDADAEYNEFRKKSFAGTTRTMVREVETIYDSMEVDPDNYDFFLLRRVYVHLSRSQVETLRDKLIKLLEETRSQSVDPQETKMHLVAYICPTVGQSRKWLQTKKKKKGE